ncbi:RNAse R [Faunimonas pinastri]|uniref:Ribonuclease R n=1 Tax=Faunimonas pinastri TaxID=1855383 RepID=A0A1H9CFT3_9HYPH|nr:ribonuclease R [Faunimonas pinastri]SEQ00065.1 RNAse R [Faunimonas pinastri]
MAKARKGETPQILPSREDILAFIAQAPGKVGKREIARAFGISGGDKIGLKRVLREMSDDGAISGPRTKLRRPGDLPSVTVLMIEAIDDQGDPVGRPVEWDEEWGEAPRIRVPADRAKGRARAMTAPGIGDRVLARLVPEDGGQGYVGRVIKMLERKPPAMLGIFRMIDGQRRIVPVDRKGTEYVVPPDGDKDAEDGELVSVEVMRGRSFGLPAARVKERIGDVSSEKAISLIALEEHGIPYVFPQSVLDEAEGAEPASMSHREDWRGLPLITIDPVDARDHDDAVYAEPDPDSPGGFVVTVAIADVAYYVRPDNALDREAVKRGNSVYFPGRVVPMLPERISNDLCSLREGEDRPAMAVRMHFNADGRKTAHRFHRVMMRSSAKLSYQQAQAAIEGRTDEKTGPLLEPVLKPLWQAYGVLAKGRDAREPLAIDLPERKVILAENGSVDRIVVPPRLEAHRLIEEFMIQANVAAAETLEARHAPVVYRIHDEPSFEKLDALRDFLGTLDMSLPKAGNIRPSQLNNILGRVEETPNAILVNEVMLRSQSQAVYSIENIGHFGLNLRRYAHFTSPIRRYADLLVHRSLISALGLGEGGLRAADEKALDNIAGEISTAERRAMAAERDTVDRLIATWLADRVGATFTGRVRGVTRSGLFVELADSGADGFIPISTIGDDFYEFHEAHHRLVGRNSGETFQLGDAVEVRLAEALPFAGSLRFELVGEGRTGRPSSRRKPEGKRFSGKPARTPPAAAREPRSRKPSSRKPGGDDNGSRKGPRPSRRERGR